MTIIQISLPYLGHIVLSFKYSVFNYQLLLSRTCTDLYTIPDSINNLYKNSDVDDTNATVHVSRGEVAAINQKNEELMTTLAEVKQKNEEDLESFVENMKAALGGFKAETHSTFENTHKKQVEEIVAEKEKVKHIMESIEVNVEKMKKAKGNIVQEFIYMKMTQTMTRELKSLDQQTKTKNEVAVIVEQHGYTDKFMEYFKKSPAVNPKNIEAHGHRLYTVKQKHKIDVRSSTDTSPCCIQGSCLTQTGSLLLVDSNNLKLKLVDITSLTVVDECYVYRPEDVCCISETEAVVACYSNSIQFISLVDQLTPTTTLQINQYCCGIAYRSGNLFVSDWSNSVFVYDMNGHLLKGVSQDNIGSALFSESRKLAFSDDNRLFVCDQEDSNGVIILNEEVELIGKAKDIGVDGAYAICGDGKGNMFVCGHYSHNVVQIRNCGSKVGEVLNQSDGMYSPRSACFHSKTNRLFVTCLDDYITMFELQ